MSLLSEVPVIMENKEYESSSKRSKTISKVWDVFLKIPAERDEDSKAMCTYCRKVFSAKSNNGEMRKAIAMMIVIDKQTFRLVADMGFKRVMAVACPKFEMMRNLGNLKSKIEDDSSSSSSDEDDD
ncbi:hypothetical protein Patl1_17303 [Pistacia atlantica]|uniref:Uncharacterized protein n=1 Tax=Pistacia atlantica TaxID=434234 RepID=A0ACC1B5H4_9ROSI|nr:hypothetical protein Patl1_17303 [Pistacia atlantica]